MLWKDFFREWLQRLFDMLLSVKVLLLISMMFFIIKNINVSTTIATIITTVIGIREGYKVVRSIKQPDNDDRV